MAAYVLPVSGFAAQSPFDIPAHAPDQLIVRFRAGVSESDRLRARSMLLGSRVRSFGLVEGLEVIKLPAGLAVEAAINQFRQHQDVLYAEPNYIVHTTSTPNDPSFSSLWGLQKTGQAGGTLDADIDATDAWNVTTGSSSVVVAVIDTGIDYNHQDISANLFRNAADCNHNGIDDDGNGFVDDCFGIDTVNNDSDPIDDHSHGTHVAGTIGAAGNNGVGVVGVNWNVKIMACKFLDSTGSGYLSDAIDCLEYVARMKDRGVNIIATNNSWGGGWFSEAFFKPSTRTGKGASCSSRLPEISRSTVQFFRPATTYPISLPSPPPTGSMAWLTSPISGGELSISARPDIRSSVQRLQTATAPLAAPRWPRLTWWESRRCSKPKTRAGIGVRSRICFSQEETKFHRSPIRSPKRDSMPSAH